MTDGKTKKTKRMAGKNRRYRRKKYQFRKPRLTRPIGGAVNLSQSPLPDTFKTILRYNQQAKKDIYATNQVSTHIMCLNGLYRPDMSYAVGPQPRGFDQFCALYNKYMVVGAKVNLEVINTSAVPLHVGYLLSQTADPVGGAFPTIRDYIEGNPDSQYMTLGPGASSKDRYQAVIKFSPKKFFSRQGISDDAQFYGTQSANPSLPGYITVWSGAIDQTATITGKVFINYTIEYICVFKEPKVIAQS